MIEAQKTKKAIRVVNLGLCIAVPFQHRHQIRQRVFDPVNLPGAECRRRRAAIWNPDQLKPIKMHALTARCCFGGFVTRHISVITRGCLAHSHRQ